jgi:hypothetical protein
VILIIIDWRVFLEYGLCNVPAVTRKFYGRRQKLPESSVVQDRRAWNYLEEEYSLIIVTQRLRAELCSRINTRLIIDKF